MANREKGEVALVAGGNTYTLRMSINAVAEIEDLLDKGINDILAIMQRKGDFRISIWRAILWGALREHHDVSLFEAGDIMLEAGPDIAIEKLNEAMAAAFPASEGADQKNPRQASPAAGKRSSRPGASQPAGRGKSSG